jgi:hypothetical protein
LKRLTSVLLVAVCGVALAQSAGSDSDAVKRLSKVRMFAFGGVGFAGVTSQGEKDFRVIFAEPPATSLARFENLYADGTPEAKSYALAGIRKLDGSHFKELLQTLQSSQEKVMTMQGCIIEDRTMAQVAKSIDSGQYDFWLKPRDPSQ